MGNELTETEVQVVEQVDSKPKPSELIERYKGDINEIALQLANSQHDNFKYREKERDIKEVAAKAQELEAQLKVWSEFGEVEQLKAKLAEAEALKQEAVRAARHKEAEEASQALGLNAALVKVLAPDVSFEKVEIDTEEGKSVTYNVKQGDSSVPALEYFSNLGDGVLESLQTNTSADAAESESPAKRQHVQQSIGKPNTPVDMISKFVNELAGRRGEPAI